jgi:hypothetical protein
MNVTSSYLGYCTQFLHGWTTVAYKDKGFADFIDIYIFLWHFEPSVTAVFFFAVYVSWLYFYSNISFDLGILCVFNF